MSHINRIISFYCLALILLIGVRIYVINLDAGHEPNIFGDLPSDFSPLKIFGYIICGVITFFTSLYLWNHIDNLRNKEFYYLRFKRNHDYFQQALSNARSNGREREVDEILKKVIDWNEKLAHRQESVSHYLEGVYYDKRYLDLNPIS